MTIDDSTTSKLVEATSKPFISGGHSLGDFTQELLNGVFDKIKFILEPVQVNYSNEVLANQIYDLSILLFVLSLIIVGLIIVLLLVFLSSKEEDWGSGLVFLACNIIGAIIESNNITLHIINNIEP